MQILIIGGGIGGLAAAIALQQIGLAVTVFERTPELREVGAGLSLWPNAVKSLDKLGLGGPLRAMGVPNGSAGIRAWDGTPLVQLSASTLEQTFGAPTIVVHRADLQTLLRKALVPDTLRLGWECTGLRQDAEGVTARFADGQAVRGDLLIGADGIRSITRTQILGEQPLRYAGYTAWRGVAHFAHDQLLLGETWGRGTRFGIAPLNQERVYWFATRNAPAGSAAAPAGHKAELLRHFRGWHDPIPAVIAATDTAAILPNDIYDLQPLKRWGHGRVTLLGDVAHAMTPNLGQGACQALEDAVALAAGLRTASHGSAGLRAYEARRISRANAIVRQSWRVGRIAQLENPLAVGLRNLVFKHSPPAVSMRQFTWLLGHEV
ncbi:MAG: FAD-dependent monooxygenase [Chloroflexaceae bacterium]